MQLSRSLSTISLVVALAACNGDETCGPGAAGDAIVVGEADTTLTFGGLSSLTGNDCPDPDAPEGVISIAISGTQIDEGATGRLTLCIPRPDLLEQGNRTLGSAISTADVRIIDVKGTHAGCTFTFDETRVPTGTAGASGVCKNATDPAGFALDMDAKFSLERDCNGTIDVVGVTMVGVVEVAFRAE